MHADCWESGDPCSGCFDEIHALEHPEIDPDCFACKVGTIQLDAKIHATRATKVVPPRRPDNAWERGVAGEHRVDGSFMPYVDPSLAPLSVKQFADNRSRNEEQIRRYREGVMPSVTT